MKDASIRRIIGAACTAGLAMLIRALSACDPSGGQDQDLIVGAGGFSTIQAAIDMARDGDAIGLYTFASHNTVNVIKNNEFTGNLAYRVGGAIFLMGNNFTGNTAHWRGGAMVILQDKTYGSGNTLMTYANYAGFNTFTDNTATLEPAYGDIYLDS